MTADPTTEWAKKVIDGTILSGELMRMAAERHMRDMRAKHLQWHPDRAQEALDFFPSVFSVTAGAKAGEPFALLNYLTFVVGSLFGWYKDGGKLRFRECWCELGKGMVKTPLSAAIGLYIMGWRGIPRSEIYAIAKDRNQANVLFQDAVNLCRAPIPGTENESLESAGHVVVRGTGAISWMIEHPDSNSKFRSLANDERISGPRPTMVAADEIHEWKSSAQIELWRAALTKMPGDCLLMLTTNTPAADQIMATDMSEFYQGVLRRTINDDSSLALIARVDTNDNPMEDEGCWSKALPLLGITFPVENVRVAVNSSKHRLATSLATQRLYFGVPVGSSDYWIDLDSWQAVQGPVDEEELVGMPCHLSLDLSLKNDLTALGVLWEHPDGLPRVKVYYWRPADNVVEAGRDDGAPYAEWAHNGHLLLVPGLSIEYEFVAAKVQEICARHDVQELAFDPAHIVEFRKACARIGFETFVWNPDEDEEIGMGLRMIVHGQGRMGMNSKRALWMPRSLQATEDAILQKDIIIEENPITSWCTSNAAVNADAQNNRWLVKKRARGRIDGIVAIAMVIGAWKMETQWEKFDHMAMIA